MNENSNFTSRPTERYVRTGTVHRTLQRESVYDAVAGRSVSGCMTDASSSLGIQRSTRSTLPNT